jgi:hypothetical protein
VLLGTMVGRLALFYQLELVRGKKSKSRVFFRLPLYTKRSLLKRYMSILLALGPVRTRAGRGPGNCS